MPVGSTSFDPEEAAYAAYPYEHYGTCNIGKTLVLNAGYGGEKNTLLELEDGKIKSIKFHGKKK